MKKYDANVIQFPGREPDPVGMGQKLFLTLMVGFLAYLLTIMFSMSEEGMTALIILGVVYYAFTYHRRKNNVPYFVRFHLLTALILDFFLLIGFLLSRAILSWFLHLLSLFSLPWLPLLYVLNIWTLLFMGLFWGSAVWLAWNILWGRTPFITWVTPNVQAWV